MISGKPGKRVDAGDDPLFMEDTEMTSHFFLSVGLIMIAFSLCYWFRNEK